MTATRGSDRHDNLDALHQRLVDEVRKIRTGDDWRAWLDAAARFHTYSFRNILLITAQRPDATRVAGYNTWKQLGRQVTKGEKGIEILAPIFSRRGTDRSQDASADEPANQQRHDRLVGVRRTYVWDISQTSGPDLPAPPAPAHLTEPAPEGLWDDLAQQVDHAGFTLHREQLGSNAEYGYTSYANRRIVVAQGLSAADAAATLAHEVAHMLMHDPTDFTGRTTRSCRGIREVEAESVAYLVAAHRGLATDRASFPYVATWASRADDETPEAVVQETGQRVMTTAHRIIETMSPGTDTEASPPRVEHQLTASRIRGGIPRAVDSPASSVAPDLAPHH